jgi:hypothetical protein
MENLRINLRNFVTYLQCRTKKNTSRHRVITLYLISNTKQFIELLWEKVSR